MDSKSIKARRAFIGTMAAGAAAGLSLITGNVTAGIEKGTLAMLTKNSGTGASAMETMLKSVGRLQHAVAYDISQANPWGMIWSNIYYGTNAETGTHASQLGVLNVFRHHGMIFALNDAVIKKYKLGEFFGLKDPTTNQFALRNPYDQVKEGTFPVSGLAGIPGLQKMGTKFCVCNMALKVYAGFVGQKAGVSSDQVYQDFVSNRLPGVELAPSGVWVLGRLSEHNIAYIDSSVG